jgi:hypothetical protein
MPNHEIRADLIGNDKGMSQAFGRASGSAQKLERSIGTAQSAADSLFSKLLAIGGTYASFNTAFGIFSRLTSSAIKYTSALEATKIGLSSIMSAVENVPWERATKMANVAFEKIKKMSITSPGSAQDMFGIFNGIVGPVRAAGAPLEKVYSLTNDTTLAAAALGVDFQQASRDINMMMRGAAGVDVKMFSLLKSTGAIAESTEQWNKSLTGAQRVEKLSAALAKFAGSGEAFGHSWAGVMSTFQGLTDELKRTTFQPLMKAVAHTVDGLNDVLDKHSDRIGRSFEWLGDSMVRVWDSTLGRLDWNQVMIKFERGVVVVGNAMQTAAHWADELSNNWGRLTKGISDAMPMLKMAAGIYLGHRVMGALGAGGAGGGGVAAAMGGGGGAPAGGKSGDWRSPFAKLASGGEAAVAGSLGPVAGYAAGKGASGMGYKTAAAASLLMPFAAPGLFLQAYLNQGKGEEGAGAPGGGGGGGGGAGEGLGGLATLANSVSAALVVTEHWSRINAAFAPTVEEAEQSTATLAKASLNAGTGVARLWGQIEVFAAGIGATFMPVLSKLQEAMAGVMDHVSMWADNINYYLAPAFDYAIGKMGEIAVAISKFLDPLAKFFKLKTNEGWEKDTAEYTGQNLDYTMLQKTTTPSDFVTPNARKPSSVTNVNASGARVTIKQSFGDQDPDRVVQLMMNDLTTQAESRLTSAFAPAFTR